MNAQAKLMEIMDITTKLSEKYISYFMDIAERTSQMSQARRLKVGGVAVKNRRIISSGWNGTPEGWDNACETEVNGQLITKPEVLHAEQNIICQLASGTETGKGASLFLTHSPCTECAKLIFQIGFKDVYYKEEYRDPTSINMLKRFGVNVVHVGVSGEPS